MRSEKRNTGKNIGHKWTTNARVETSEIESEEGESCEKSENTTCTRDEGQDGCAFARFKHGSKHGSKHGRENEIPLINVGDFFRFLSTNTPDATSKNPKKPEPNPGASRRGHLHKAELINRRRRWVDLSVLPWFATRYRIAKVPSGPRRTTDICACATVGTHQDGR
ncbi:hypothetical protein J6590_035264 [Homalodisca vitripennis]|nr:hypothetical protein J6590_035264 [Homalodisca vitripennis]